MMKKWYAIFYKNWEEEYYVEISSDMWIFIAQGPKNVNNFFAFCT